MPAAVSHRRLDGALVLCGAALLGAGAAGGVDLAGAGLAALVLGIVAVGARAGGDAPTDAVSAPSAGVDGAQSGDAADRDATEGSALAALLALLPSPVVACDRHGRILAASGRAAEVCGSASADALVGTHLDALVGTDAAAWALAAPADVAGSEAATGCIGDVSRRVRVAGVDGTLRDAEATVRRAPGSGSGLRLVDLRRVEGAPEAGLAPETAPPETAPPEPASPQSTAPDAASAGVPASLWTSKVGVLVTRRSDGRVLDANGAFLDLCGGARDAVVGSTADALGLWECVGNGVPGVDAPATDDDAAGRRCRLPGADGRERTVRVWTHASGVDAVLTLVAPDDADPDDSRAKAEEALAAERDFTQVILDTSGQGIVIADADDRLVYANLAFAEVTGRALGDLPGQTFRDLIAREDRPAYDGQMDRRRGGERGVYETCFARPDGTRRCVLITAMPHPSGEAGASIALITDLTAIKEAQRETERQRAFYEGIVERLPVSIVLTDADWRFRFANPCAIRSDALRAWSLGRTFEEIAAHAEMPAPRRAAYARARAHVEATGEAAEWTEEVHERGRDGLPDTTRHLLQHIEPLRGPDGELSGYLGYAVDVTARVVSERQAEAAKAFYETILGELPIPLVVFDADTRVLYANPALAPRPSVRERLIGGYMPDRMARLMGVQGDGRDRLAEVVETGQRQQWEEARAAPGQPTRYLLASLTPIPGPDGRVAHVVGYSVDVTAQREGQQAVERTKEYYQGILQRLPVEVCTFRPDGTFDFLNAAAVRDEETRAWLVGRTSADYARRRGFDVAPFEARDAWVRSALETPRESTYEEYLELPERPARHMMRALSPVFDEAGSLAYVISYGIDLTERLIAASQQEAQRAFYEGVLGRLPLDVVVFDTEGRFLYISPLAVRDEAVRAAALGRRNVDLARLRRRPTDGAEARDAWIRGAIEARTTVEYEERLVDPDGTVREVMRSAVPILLPSGEVDFVVAFTVDFTERKRYEQSLLEAKEKAEELARLKSTFLANMSHEVRTPLAGIIGFAEVLVDELDEPHREAAQLIRQSGMRLLDTLNSVLDLARLEANAVELELSRLDLGPEVEATGRLFQGMTSARALTLVVEAAPAPVWAMIDARAFHRVLVNLVSNAVKFTNEGEVRLTVGQENGEAVVRVADTGVGMDAAFLPHVFAEFRQESAGLTRTHQGSGLGLAITRRLVGLMHGRIEVESVKGEGTTFTVRFPLA